MAGSLQAQTFQRGYTVTANTDTAAEELEQHWKVPEWNKTFISFVYEHAHVEETRTTNRRW